VRLPTLWLTIPYPGQLFLLEVTPQLADRHLSEVVRGSVNRCAKVLDFPFYSGLSRELLNVTDSLLALDPRSVFF
jgi:hypothetical protein